MKSTSCNLPSCHTFTSLKLSLKKKMELPPVVAQESINVKRMLCSCREPDFSPKLPDQEANTAWNSRSKGSSALFRPL